MSQIRSAEFLGVPNLAKSALLIILAKSEHRAINGLNGRSTLLKCYRKKNLKPHHHKKLLKKICLKFALELLIFDYFRKSLKSKIRVPFWAGVRIITIANASQLTTLIKVDLNINRR